MAQGTLPFALCSLPSSYDDIDESSFDDKDLLHGPALERVVLEGWDAAKAWEHDAVAFGYRPVLFHANIADSFKSAVAALAPRK